MESIPGRFWYIVLKEIDFKTDSEMIHMQRYVYTILPCIIFRYTYLMSGQALDLVNTKPEA